MIRTKKASVFGGCSFANLSPKTMVRGPAPSMLAVAVSFEESLKLSLAIQECISKLNRYNRASRAGRAAALNLKIHLKKGRVTVSETRLRHALSLKPRPNAPKSRLSSQRRSD